MPETMWDFDSLPGSAVPAADALASPESVNAAVAQVMDESVGDAPVPPEPSDDLVVLPGGLYWAGQLHREAVVRELDGEDEEELARVKGSLARWVTELLTRTVVRIGDHPATRDMIKACLIGDRDALLLGVRIASLGSEITLQHVQCPHCERYFDATVDLHTMDQVRLDDPRPGHTYPFTLRKGGTAQVRLPDGAAQEQMLDDSDATMAQRNSDLLAACVTEVVGPDGVTDTRTGRELARGLGLFDRRGILRFISRTQPGPSFDDLRFVHEACGEEVLLPIELGELFRGE